ncbi:MAG: BamA/TamA family outer membrane protein [Verrucomicrobiales bacterium]|nr:BamA/TamA family outer membrane protein [Verrucomicrobiales bacterium]
MPISILLCGVGLLAGGARLHSAEKQAPELLHAVVGDHVRVGMEGLSEAEWKEVRGLLDEQLRLAGDAGASEPLADDLAYFSRQHLLRHGWPDVQVNWQVEGDDIRLTVIKGGAVKLGKVCWAGDASPVPLKDLEALFLRPTREHEEHKKSPPWVDGAVQEGAGLVQRQLRAHGYLQAKVEARPLATGDAAVRDVEVSLHLGPAFSFGVISLTGVPAELEAEIQELTASRIGNPFNEAEVESLVQRLKGICVAKGRLGTEGSAQYALGAKGGTVDVRITLEVPPPSMVRGLQTAENLSAGAARVLRSTFRPALGRVYSAEELDLVYRRALDTGMFSRLDQATEPSADSSLDSESRPVLLKLEGEEVSPMSVGLYGGYETFSGPILGIEFRHVNLFNSGDQFRAAAEYSSGGPVGKLELTDPAVFGSGFAATGSLGLERFALYDYSRSSIGANFAVTRRVSIPFSYSVFVSGAVSSVTAPDLTLEESGPLDYTTCGVGGSITLDKRNSPVLPTKGWLLEGRIEGLGDASGDGVSFLRGSLRLGAYWPVSDRWRLSAGLRMQAVSGAEAEDIPIDLRVFNGGANSVRSFAERELGPLSAVNETPLGGTRAITANLELSYGFTNSLEAAVFGDAGSLDTSGQFGFSSDLRYGIGAGLRYLLPFGPLRVDYGWNPSRREGEKAGALHISLGVAF